jgi:hypothetical protein
MWAFPKSVHGVGVSYWKWELKLFIKFYVGDGSQIHLWFDDWHPNEVLHAKYGPHVIMMLKASMMLGFLHSSKMGSGCGGLLDLICLLRFKVNWVWFLSVERILLTGLFQSLVNFLGRILRMQSVLDTTRWSCGIWFGFLSPSQNRHLWLSWWWWWIMLCPLEESS